MYCNQIKNAYQERDRAIYLAFKPVNGYKGKRQREIALESGLSLSRIKVIIKEQRELLGIKLHRKSADKSLTKHRLK